MEDKDTYISYIDSYMAVDDLATPGAGASAVMVNMTKYSQKIPDSALAYEFSE